jgi:hypothetical protein
LLPVAIHQRLARKVAHVPLRPTRTGTPRIRKPFGNSITANPRSAFRAIKPAFDELHSPGIGDRHRGVPVGE